MTAFFVAILILPITLIVQSFFSDSSGTISIIDVIKNIGIVKPILFLIFEVAIFKLSDSFRLAALDIYDELYPDNDSAD